MNWKKLMLTFGTAFLFASTIVMVYTFFMAYFNDYRVMVTINDYGEAQVEFVMLVILFPLSMYAFYNMNKRLHEEGDD